MKQVHANYTFVASTKTITLTGLNIAQDQLLLVTNATRGVIYYNFASSSHRAVVTAGANTTVVLTDASTTGHADSDQLTIHYDDQVSGSSVSISNFPATQVVSVSNLPASQVVSVSNFPASSSVTIANFPAAQVVTGTVTVSNKVVVIPDLINPLYSVITSGSIIRVYDTYGQDITVNTDNGGINASLVNSVTIGSLPTISGTVTANVGKVGYDGGNNTNYFPIAFVDSPGGTLIQVSQDSNGGLPISGTVTVGNSVTIGSLPAISGTVTAAAPNGSLTTRFGSVTTANTAQITSAVTNNSRKYLLIQNVTTSSNVITVGIGFTPTTTQGIQLTAGAGITFESSYIPTGAVMILSSVTASPFTVIEA